MARGRNQKRSKKPHTGAKSQHRPEETQDRSSKSSHVPSVFLYLIAVLVLIWPTFGNYLWYGHEKFHAAVRLSQMCEVWRAEGPCRATWMPDVCFGYGWPFFAFYAPLGYYVGAVSHFLLSLDFGASVRLSFYVSLIVGGLLMYMLTVTVGRRHGVQRLSWWAAAIAAAYTFCPYHLTDVFTRGSLAESWAWAIIPGLFWGIELTRDRPWAGTLLTAFMQAMLILSHNIMALYGTGFAVLYVVLTTCRLLWLIRLSASAFLGVAMASFFWYPAFRLLPLVEGADAGRLWGTPAFLAKHALHWRQFFLEQYGRGPSKVGLEDGFAINQGHVLVLCVGLCLVALFRPGLSTRHRYRLGVVLALFGIIWLVMSTAMPWHVVPQLLLYLQFPWRLLLLTSFFACFATAMAIPLLNRWLHPAILFAVAVIASIGLLPVYLVRPSAPDMSNQGLLKWYEADENKKSYYAGCIRNEYKPIYVDWKYMDASFHVDHPAPYNRLSVEEGNLQVDAYERQGNTYRYQITAETDTTVRFRLFDFPGWELTVDGQERPDQLGRTEDGLVQAGIPAGSREIELSYRSSPGGVLASRVSFVAWGSWALLVSFGIWRWRRQDGGRGRDRNPDPQ